MNSEEYNNLKVGKKYTYICIKCGKGCEAKKRSKKYQENQLKFLCRGCLKQDTEKNRYKGNFPKRKPITREEKEKASEKRKQTLKEKYGVINATYLKDHNQKSKETCLKKYGVENPSQSKEIKEKIKQNNLNKYGVKYYSQTKEYKESILKNKNKISENIKKGKELSKIEEKKSLEEKYGELISLKDLSQKLNRDLSGIYLSTKNLNMRIDGKYGCFLKVKDIDILKNNLERKSVSIEEKEVVSFLKNIWKGEIIENDRKILNGKELDIYIPSKNLAIEYNGLYWHSDKATLGKNDIPNRETRMYAKYRHIEKTKLCEEKNIRLIHIFEDDWIYRKDIIKDILKQSLGIYDRKIYARKCEVKKIDNKVYKNFLEENHLQGYSLADVRLGLFYEKELVECIGINSKGNHSNNSELVRLCTKKNYKVLGGFSKLLKHSGFFHLISYIDIGTFEGKGYKKSNWKFIKENPPVYFYIDLNLNSTFRIPRYRYFKLKENLSYFNPEETEEINMYKNEYARIWNCGTIKVEWKI